MRPSYTVILVAADGIVAIQPLFSTGARVSHYTRKTGDIVHYPDERLPAACTWAWPTDAATAMFMEPDPVAVASILSLSQAPS